VLVGLGVAVAVGVEVFVGLGVAVAVGSGVLVGLGVDVAVGLLPTTTVPPVAFPSILPVLPTAAICVEPVNEIVTDPATVPELNVTIATLPVPLNGVDG
jgi:hypothetical protein